MKPSWPLPFPPNSMKPGSTRSIASRSQPLISTIRHRPVNRTTDFGRPLAMRRQRSHRGEDRFEAPSFDGETADRQRIRAEAGRGCRGSGRDVSEGWFRTVVESTPKCALIPVWSKPRLSGWMAVSTCPGERRRWRVGSPCRRRTVLTACSPRHGRASAWVPSTRASRSSMTAEPVGAQPEARQRERCPLPRPVGPPPLRSLSCRIAVQAASAFLGPVCSGCRGRHARWRNLVRVAFAGDAGWWPGGRRVGSR
jgi:hypothetical protein